ncbi:MAG TPA: hypothetical protein VL282_18960 [Tepidisphaeraceae bacterium]|jgi:hypothetical protein|nr:hypothetical protein [Tepidisphaeraceae bacterium]
MKHRTQRSAAATAVVAGLLAALSPSPAANAATVLYKETSDNLGTPNTGILFKDNPVYENNDATGIDLDNVVIPTASAGDSLQVTQVTFQLLRRDGSPLTTLSAFYQTIATDRLSPGGAPTLNNPPTQFGSAQLSAIPSNGTATPTVSTETATIGDGVNILFTLAANQLNFTDPALAAVTGGEFAIGFTLNDNGAVDSRGNVPFQGVQLAKPDAGFQNPDESFFYTSSQSGAFTFFASNDVNNGAGFYMTLSGNVVDGSLVHELIVPEPATISLAALGGILLLARRASRKETCA